MKSDETDMKLEDENRMSVRVFNVQMIGFF